MSIISGGKIIEGARHRGGETDLVASDVIELQGAGAPVDATTGANSAGKGSRYTDTTNSNLYINAGTKASPVWKLVTRAA